MAGDVRPRDDLHALFGEALDAAVEVDEEVRALHGTLASQEDLRGLLEERLRRAMALRDEATARIGRLAIAWVRSGGSVALEEDEGDDEEVDAAAVPTEESKACLASETAAAPPSVASLEALRQGLGPRWAAPTAAPPEPRPLHVLLNRIGTPLAVRETDALEPLIARLVALLDDPADLSGFPSETQRELLGLVVCCLRDLQERARALGREDLVARFDEIFPRFSGYCREYRPGTVFGLRRSDTPRRGSWLADALQHWIALGGAAPTPEQLLTRLDVVLYGEPCDGGVMRAVVEVMDGGVSATDPRLVDRLRDRERDLEGEPRLKPLRRAIRDFRGAEVEDADETAVWPHLHLTRDLRAVVLGGDDRNGVAERIRAAFELGDLDWQRGHGVRRVEALVERIRSGSVDLVLLVRRFVSHQATQPVVAACRETGTPLVAVDGYGIGQLRRGLERQLGG